jgi:hypothetical protein
MKRFPLVLVGLLAAVSILACELPSVLALPPTPTLFVIPTLSPTNTPLPTQPPITVAPASIETPAASETPPSAAQPVPIPAEGYYPFFSPSEQVVGDEENYLLYHSFTPFMGQAAIVEDPQYFADAAGNPDHDFARAVEATGAFVDDDGAYHEVPIVFMVERRDGTIIRPGNGFGTVFEGSPEELVAELDGYYGQQVVFSFAVEASGSMGCEEYMESIPEPNLCPLLGDWAVEYGDLMREFESTQSVPEGLRLLVAVYIPIAAGP